MGSADSTLENSSLTAVPLGVVIDVGFPVQRSMIVAFS
jgi:hypothetical protein